MKKSLAKFFITTGDPDGIGAEITAKALLEMHKPRLPALWIWRSANVQTSLWNKLNRHYKRLLIKEEELKNSILDSPPPNTLIEIISSRPAHEWFKTSVSYCEKNLMSGIITGPLSKTAAFSADKAPGHTAILRAALNKKNLFMGFLGKHFNVLLLTDHLPFKKVSEKISADLIQDGILSSQQMLQFLNAKNQKKPMALVGLNPHAGEDGILGDEEEQFYKPALAWAKKEKITVYGPLSPDVAFQQQNLKRFSLFISPYHDQGLIPFKMVHGFSGVHVTLGLPFIRTSVDHGTAKDIYGKNRASPVSMIQAIQAAFKIEANTRRLNNDKK